MLCKGNGLQVPGLPNGLAEIPESVIKDLLLIANKPQKQKQKTDNKCKKRVCKMLKEPLTLLCEI